MSIQETNSSMVEVDSVRLTAVIDPDDVAEVQNGTGQPVHELNGLPSIPDEGEHTQHSEQVVAVEGVAISLNGHRQDLRSPTQSDSHVTAEKLTERQIQILQLMVDGNTNTASLANMLAYSESTVKNMLQAIYRQLGVSKRPDAIVQAVKLGLVHIGIQPATDPSGAREHVKHEAAPQKPQSVTELFNEFSDELEDLYTAQSVSLSDAEIQRLFQTFREFNSVSVKIAALGPKLKSIIQKAQAAS